MSGNIAKDTQKGRAMFPNTVVAVGAAAAANITVAGMNAKSQIISVVGTDPDAVAAADIHKVFTCTPGDGVMTCADDTSAYTLVVTFAR